MRRLLVHVEGQTEETFVNEVLARHLLKRGHKRVETIISDYEKPLSGALAALEIGLHAMRAACPGIRRWLERLENLGA